MNENSAIKFDDTSHISFCSFDEVIIRKGLKIMYTITGRKSTGAHATVFGDGSDVTITFTSDSSVTDSGFDASYEVNEGTCNRPFPSCLLPRSHSNENNFDLHENGREGGRHFHMNGFARRLVFKQKQKVTRKWPVRIIHDMQLA